MFKFTKYNLFLPESNQNLESGSLKDQKYNKIIYINQMKKLEKMIGRDVGIIKYHFYWLIIMNKYNVE